MREACLICLDWLGARDTVYHGRCAKQLFGSVRAPAIDIDLAKLQTLALAMVGHTSLAGVQRKLSVSLDAPKLTLQLATQGGRYILKPQALAFPAVPENEFVTMALARLCGLRVETFGLLHLADGTPAYLCKRFDRAGDGRKRRQEDFCQLSECAPSAKYQASAEACARLVLRYASEPIIESQRLFQQFLFSWWVGNGDLHLKNLSLLADDDGRFKLSPAYDLVATRLVIPDDRLALPVCGKQDNLKRKTWLGFAAVCQLPERAAIKQIDALTAKTDAAIALIDRSPLPVEQKGAYAALLRERSGTLAG